MPQFDYYIMVDWSGGNSRRANRNDCIWIAYGCKCSHKPICHSPASRTEAMQLITKLLEDVVGPDNHCLICFDFAFGYPAGFASHLPSRSGEPPWTSVWRYLTENIVDDIGSVAGRVVTNKSNRFEVVSMLNQLVASAENSGPFWAAAPNWREANPSIAKLIPQEQPSNFMSNADVSISPLRKCDETANSKTPFCTFVTGSVGSQILMGIPRLEALRRRKAFANSLQIWPFETGWAPNHESTQSNWLGDDVRLIVAEIYPSVQEPMEDQINDRGQVRSMWHWARDLDIADKLLPKFAIPKDLSDAEESIARTEEGWILS